MGVAPRYPANPMRIRALGAWAGVAGIALGGARGAAEVRELRFERAGELVARVALAEIRAACATRTVEVDDPYYGRRKRFVACPLDRVLELGFGTDAEGLGDQDVFFRARDGYLRPARARLLAEGGAHLAFADADRAQGDDPGWEPIDRRQLDPGPFYLVWTGAGQNDPHHHPWPYQLVAIALTSFASTYPHAVPPDAPPDSPARAGFDLFRSRCFSCHAINGEGGRVGPELNVPRSIVEYRDVEQLKAFIRDPRSFRYTTMPGQPDLSDGQLDALIAYFEWMRSHKHDPGAGS